MTQYIKENTYYAAGLVAAAIFYETAQRGGKWSILLRIFEPMQHNTLHEHTCIFIKLTDPIALIIYSRIHVTHLDLCLFITFDDTLLCGGMRSCLFQIIRHVCVNFL